MLFGDRLKDLREKHKISQRELSEMVHISQSVVSAYERNAAKPKFEHIAPLAQALNTSTDYLLGLNSVAGSDTWIVDFLRRKQHIAMNSADMSHKAFAGVLDIIIKEIEQEIERFKKKD